MYLFDHCHSNNNNNNNNNISCKNSDVVCADPFFPTAGLKNKQILIVAKYVKRER